MGRKVYNLELLRQEIKRNPTLREEQLVFDNGREYPDNFNSAQRVTPFDFYNKYGKIVCRIKGATQTGYLISLLPDNNFGSIADHSIDTVPKALVRIKGTEITYLSNDNLRYANKHLLSRRFVSKVLSYWCYLNGIKYSAKDRKNSGIEMWCLKMKYQGSKHITYLLSGIEVKELIKDIIKETRNHNPKAFYEYEVVVDNPYEPNIDGVIVLAVNKNGKLELVNNLYLVRWKFPKYSVDYLKRLLNELDSGNYFLDIYVPIIHNLWKYPIKCTDTHETDIYESEKTTDSYDLTQYLAPQY